MFYHLNVNMGGKIKWNFSIKTYSSDYNRFLQHMSFKILCAKLIYRVKTGKYM